MNLGNAIKNMRKQKALTQEEMSSKCTITQTYLSQIENNQKEPNLSTLKKISDALEVPLPILFYLSMDENDVSPDKAKDFKVISPSVNSMIHAFFSV